MKYKRDFITYFSGFPLFTFSDARLFLSKHGASYDYSRKLISLMLQRGEIYRVTKGYYTTKADLTVAGYAFKPFYYGLGFALSYYGLSNQGYNLTIITTKNVREGVRSIFGANVVINKIQKDLFFGYIDVPTQTFHYYISDVEKTFADMLHFEHVVEDYVYENIFKRINTVKMKEYLKCYGKKAAGRYAELERQFGILGKGKRLRK